MLLRFNTPVAALPVLCFVTAFPAICFGLTPSSVTLTGSPNPASYGQAVTLTAAVSSGATGKVTFYDGTTVLGTGTLSTTLLSTQATLTTVMLASGNRSLRAYYDGDATYASSSSAPFTQTVVAGVSLGFRHAVNYSTSSQIASMAVGDFNGDGKQDVVMAIANNGVSVLIGKGDETFQAGVNYGTPSAATSVAIGDFNGDGRMDLVVTSLSNVSVLLGNGDGTFQAAVNYLAGSYPYAVAVGDFNGDGDADLVVANNGGSNLTVLLGNGDGTFRAAVNYAVGLTPLSVAVGDFNGDGKADIVVGTYSGMSVLLGNGNGTFVAAVNYPLPSSNVAVTVGDFNGDGKADLAVASSLSVNVLLGNGDGTFGTAVNYATGTTIFGLVEADLDGDGKTDLTATTYYGAAVVVLLGNGDGTFKPAVTYPITPPPSILAVGDFNGDGKADLIVAHSNNSGFSELLGGAIADLTIAVTHGNGFTEGQAGAAYSITVSNVGDWGSAGAVGVVITLPPGFTATSLEGSGWTCVVATLVCTRNDSLPSGASCPVITAKFNLPGGLTGNVTATFTVSGGGDQNATNNQATDTIFVRFPTATTLLSSPNPAVLGHAVILTATVTAGATGNVSFYDGITPLGVATLAGGQAILTTYLLPSGVRSLHAEYDGDGRFGPSFSASLTQTVTAAPANGILPSGSYKVDVGPVWVGVGDFNGDGKPDLVTANIGTCCSFGGNGSMSVLLGDGDGTFRPAVNYSAGSYANSGVVGDFNSDGKADVVIAGNAGLYVLLGNGDGTFRNALLSNTSNNYTSLGSADFNGDGVPDLVALSGGSVVIFLGNGDGTFQPPATVMASGVYFSFLAVADMNVDGKADLIGLSTSYSAGATVLLGNGDGTFQPGLNGPGTGNANPMAFSVGDFNGDGKPDVAMVYWTAVALQLGNGDGSLQTGIVSNLSFTPGSFALAGDFNGDGKLDIAYVGYVSSFVYLAFGNGDGTFQFGGYEFGASFATDGYQGTVVQGDFNGDGKPDFAVSNNNTSTVNVFLGGQFSGLNISATHAGNFTVGQTGVYQIAIQNPAFARTNGSVTVTDTLPAGLTATSISGSGWTCTLSTLTCTRSDALGNNASYPTITIAVNVAGSLSPSTIINRASVSSGGIVNTAADPTRIVVATMTTLTVSPNPSSLGQTVTMTATVSAGTTGAVLFSDGDTPLGTATLTGGTASFSTNLLASGQRLLVATYAGDSTRAPSTSNIILQTVNASPASGFGTGANFTTGAGPWAIAVGDFNRDGIADLVTANSTAGTISVLPGNGDGTFGSHRDYTVGMKPVAVVTGDFNNDGKTDIAAANQADNNVSILLGNGDGTFQPALNYATGKGPVALAAGDLNGDGRADLVVANGSDGTLTLLFGNGDGTFNAAAGPLAANSPNSVAIGDVNRDGKADIVYGSYAGAYVLLGNGDGTFQSYVYSNANSVNALTMGDLNADGKTDLMTADGNNGLDVLLGNGDGTFQPYVHYATGNPSGSVVCADVNGDGKLDVIVVNNVGNTIAVLLGNGDGTVQASISYSVGSSPRAAVAGDFNGDGRTDLAVANLQGNNVSVLLGVLTPVLGVTSFHVDPFGVGQNGAAYNITVLNHGPGATSGTVTVTDTLPVGLIATSIAGTGWGCTLATLSCTRSDSLAFTASYPVITVTVNVTLNMPGSVINQVSVSGGGGVAANALDPTAVVTLGSIVITANAPGISVVVDGMVYAAPAGFNWAPGSVHPVSVASPQGSAGTRFVFANWSDAGAQSHTIVAPNSTATYTTTFTAQYLLTTGVSPGGEGSIAVSPSSGDGYYASGTSVQIAATPASGYRFSTFSGDLTGGTNPQNVVMSAPRTITANFAPLATLTITKTHSGSFSPGENGASYTITVSDGAPAGPTSGAVTVTETAPNGLSLVSMSGSGWTCSSNACTRSDVLSPGNSYPPITVLVNVAGNASSPQVNQAAVSGGGSASASTADSTTISASGHPAFFSGEAALANGVYYLQFPNNNLFGYYNYVAGSIFYHYDMGFEAFIPGSGPSLYLYDFTTSHWFYTSSTLFPYLYDFTLNTWIYYLPDTKNAGHYTTKPRYFSNLSTGQIFTM